MSGKVIFASLAFLLLCSFKPFTPGHPSLQTMLAAYASADRLFTSPNATLATDSAAMLGFRNVITTMSSMPRKRMTDSLIYLSYFKLGALSEIYRDIPGATSAYLHAIRYAIDASQQFSMYIYAGSGYYKQNNFDSANFYLLLAEENVASIALPIDRARLYNTLGVLYYDNGNYLQSKNYFTQALYLINADNPSDALNAYMSRLNIATCFYKLGAYEKALDIYRQALKQQLDPNPLYMNMGRAYAALHEYSEALYYFKKVNVNEIPGVLNEMAATGLQIGRADSAASWLEKYRNGKRTTRGNGLDDGINALYSGDLEMYRSHPDAALHHFQDALNIFSRKFADPDVRKNPLSFTGSFAYYRLFEVLNKKAAAWEMKYENSRRSEDLRSAYDSYQSTIAMLTYIEKSYEMDDAKLLLKKNSGPVYQKALAVCLELHRLYPDDHFLEAAFLISEKNKASVMSAQIRERNFLIREGVDNEWLHKEKNIKFNIARLNARSDERLDATQLQKINDEKGMYETELVNLHRKMDGNRHFYASKYADDFPSIKELQSHIRSSEAVISIYNESDKINVFVLTASELKLVRLDSAALIRENMEAWIHELQAINNGHHKSNTVLKEKLYRQFTKPLLELAGEREEWIIIPDGLFFMLPFESLSNLRTGKLILEDHAVSYQFSARFIIHPDPFPLMGAGDAPVLSFAPFAQRSLDFQSEGMARLEQLPFSREEISRLPGKRNEDHEASKACFLNNLNRYPIIHLATHAVADLSNPSASYIAFYPNSGLRSEDFLFLDEIYSLRMDSCRMMVMSACETGRGALVSNEGVMSFARAFLYAGCPSTINTIWNADDHSTEEIFKSFYKYLQSGDSKSKALQKAKLDFIHNNPVNRDPAYWSHIIITGSPDALYKKKQPWLWAALIVGFGTILFLAKRIMRPVIFSTR